ncbi:hypothetical protein Tco_0173327 [Tanacetum coccineum]
MLPKLSQIVNRLYAFIYETNHSKSGLGLPSIVALSEHDCCLFRGDDNKDLDFCPACNTSRWKDSNAPGKKVPKKVLHYFPIIPRLQHLYKSSHTVKEMIWHATGKCTEPGKMQHPVDCRAWKNFDTKYPDFAKEPRNVRLGLAADGFNPFGNLSQAYSMWPDVALARSSNMRAMVLWTINDFLARSSLSGWIEQGYKACPTCNEDTSSVRGSLKAPIALGCLNDLDNATLHIDGQPTEVDAPPDIIDVVDEDDDIIDDEDPLPHDLADSDDEDLINVDDVDMSSRCCTGPTAVTVAVRIVPFHTMYPPVAWVALLTEVRISGLL